MTPTKRVLARLSIFHHLTFRLVHLAPGEHQHTDGVAMQCMVGIVGCYLDILSKVLSCLLISCLLISFTNNIGLAALLHINGASDIVARHQVVVDRLGINAVLALMVVRDKMFFLGKLLYGTDHLLALSLASQAQSRTYLLVVEGVEWIIGKDFEYLLC